MSHEKYLDDPQINGLLNKMNDAVALWQSGFMTNNYGRMCLALGMMYSIAGQVYNRNAAIDNTSKMITALAKTEDASPSIPEEVLAAFPERDASELACEGEHPPRIADVLSPSQDDRTRPAIAASSDSTSPQELFAVGQAHQVPS